MNKSNRNWVVIGLVLAFIIGWEFFVIRPYVKKHPPLPSAVTVTSTANTPGATLPLSSSASSLVSGQVLTPEQRALGRVVDFSPEKRARIFPNGVFADAEFVNYKERGSQDTVVLAHEGWAWTSTDASLAACLVGLKQEGESLVFRNSVTQGTCSVSFETISQTPGLVKSALTLTGFDGAKGFVEYRSEGNFATGPTQMDHRYLGYLLDDSRHFVRDTDLRESSVKSGKLTWLVWGDRYFGVHLLPRGDFNPNVIYGAVGDVKEHVYFGLQYPIVIKNGAPVRYDFDLYIGTRSPESVTVVDTSLLQSIDFGFFGVVARSMLWLLKTIHSVVGNYGLAIIFLTILVRLAFWPLNRKVFQSGERMKALAPEMERIKKKYGTDKSKAGEMNAEVMGLYKKHGVNPLGSCLPMLFQIPVFLGLWSALSHSIELYQTSFLWMPDLSSRDPYYIFPALWTVTLLVMTKLNPQQASQPGMPDMKWIMIVMNVVFGFMSKDWAGGLTLYLFVSNLVGISQQWMYQRASKLQPKREGA